jgi:single-strand DNA-binding protein
MSSAIANISVQKVRWIYMAGSVNKVILIGNLGADPKINNLPSGQKAANIRVATSQSWIDRASAQRRERTEWHSVAIFDPKTVEYVSQYIKKGDRIYIEGKLQTRKWQDQSGTDQFSTEIVVNSIGGKLVDLSSLESGSSTREETNTFDKQTAINSPDLGDIPF